MHGNVWLCGGCAAQVEVGVDSGRLEQALNSKHTKHKVSELIVEKEMQLLQAQPSKPRKAYTLTLTRIHNSRPAAVLLCCCAAGCCCV
jgi:hypothetical protein